MMNELVTTMNSDIRLMRRIDFEDNGCWTLRGGLSTPGYGQFYFMGTNRIAHRWAYERLVGPIPGDLTLDHVCENKRCVNPEHLEPVTREENTMRGAERTRENYRRGFCPNGHEKSVEGVYVVKKKGFSGHYYRCKKCHAIKNRNRPR